MGIERAVEHLEAGGLVVHPTESVYGLGGSLDERPLKTLRRAKGRPMGGFVLLIPSPRSVQSLLDQADASAPGHRFAQRLAEAFWPGPLTLILDDPHDLFPPLAKAADGTAAVRVPGHPVALDLLAAFGHPITSSSANEPGRPPARTAIAAHQAACAMDLTPYVLDAGPLDGGATSTLLRMAPTGPHLMRAGAVDTQALHDVLGFAPSGSPGSVRDPMSAAPDPMDTAPDCTDTDLRDTDSPDADSTDTDSSHTDA